MTFENGAGAAIDDLALNRGMLTIDASATKNQRCQPPASARKLNAAP